MVLFDFVKVEQCNNDGDYVTEQANQLHSV